MDTEQDFETLRREAHDTWLANMKAKTATLRNQADRLAQAPDVLMRPDPEIPWSYDGIICHCGGQSFLVQRWVTINGIRHRFAGICTSCSTMHTWDWSESRWID